MVATLTQRSYVGKYFQLMLDGSEAAGFLKSVEYGGIKGELLAQPVGGQPWKVKHIHNPTNEAVKVEVGMSMSKSFFDWVAKSWSGNVERRNGSIITYDANLKPVFEYAFKDAMILETQIPACDGANKDAAYLTVKFQAETAEYKFEPGGALVAAQMPAAQQLWSPSNFRLEIDGLEVKRVNKIDQFVVKQNVKPMTTGPDWMYQIEPTSLEYPNLSVTFSMINAKPWFDWHKAFVIDGKNGPANEKTGAITFLSQDLQEELLSIDLKALGMVNLALEKSDAMGGTIRRVKAELYCEEMAFDVKK